MQPSKLLKDLGVVGVTLKHATVGALGSLELFLLLIDVTDLEPDVFFCEGAWWVGDNVFEALCCR